jgi:methylisocitrate lyase
MRTVREFERAGVAGIIFEDQVVPKRCPAAATNIEILPAKVAVQKIRAAVDARTNPDFLIIARTDATSMGEALSRGRLFAEAGADLIQPISRTVTNYADLQRLREACGRPLSLQILGWLEKDLSKEQIESVAGLAVFPLVPLMTITAALQKNLAQLASDRHARGLPLPQTSMSDFKSLIGFGAIEELQQQYEME